MRIRSRGIHDVGLSAVAATKLREDGERPEDWTVLELWTAGGRRKVAILIERVEVDAATVDDAMGWLNRRDAFLRAM